MADGKRLVVLLEGEVAGTLDMNRAGRLRFSYEEDRPAGATPLSLSMPVAVRDHEHRSVSPFVEGLLPDSDRVLDRWRQEFEIRSRHPFPLLAAVGEDVAGAVQFVRSERFEAARSEGEVEWLTDRDVGEWLRGLQADPTRWHYGPVGGQFSLTGAQSKIALVRDGARWGRPSGSVPTTHILKPAIPGFPDHDVNEHVCLATARALGIPAASSAIARVHGLRTLVVERYDRVQVAGRGRRVHQEDMCQALGVPPERKYQAAGGPGVKRIAHLLWEAEGPAEARRSVLALVDQVAFHWLVGGTDAHAKNFSLLLAGRAVRLAPLYDVASALVYEDPELRHATLEMAMAIGGERRLTAVDARCWARLAGDVGLPPGEVQARVAGLADRMPGALDGVCSDAQGGPTPSDMVGRMHDVLSERAARVGRVL
ncbi:MAG: type II toxin-antitoxin system HipA family toxin [Acidimicrobiales bacterium]